MNPGSAVVEIIPYPLCNCKSPDYFYGVGGYYHGSAIASNIKHYPYCVDDKDVKWHKRPTDIKEGKNRLYVYVYVYVYVYDVIWTHTQTQSVYVIIVSI